MKDKNRKLSRWTTTGLLLLAGVPCAFAQSTLTLFNGSSLLGWNQHGGGWAANAGVLTGTGQGSGHNIMTAVPFGDFSLSFDYNESGPMQAKLRVWAPREEAGGVLVDLDGSGSKAGVGGIEGASSTSIASVPGTWHHVQVDANHGQVSVVLDGAQGGRLAGSGSRAGYLGFEMNGSGTLQVRTVRLTLAGLTPAFTGTDLGNWKSIAHSPASSGGVGHTMEKTLTFGLGGGSTKPHSAKWTVQAGAMHGEDGPGGLEYATPIEDVILQVNASVTGAAKPQHFTSFTLRNAPGQLEGGYAVGIGPYSGSIEELAKKPPAKGAGNVEETIILAGRTTAIWVGSTLTTVYTDSRPESAKTAQGARTSQGVITLSLPGDGVQVSVQRIAIAALPKGYGSAISPPTPQPVANTTSVPAASAGTNPPAASATETALLQQQQTTARQADQDRQSKQRVASLMAQALTTSDPQQQMGLYNQVVQLDPSNAPAVQGYKDAQSKVQAAAEAQQKAATADQTQQHDMQSKDQQVSGSLVKAQSAFLAGHVAEASSALTVAERLAPDNPLVRDLRSRISATSSLHSRLFYLGSGAGLLALVALIAVWIRRKRQQRFPMLEITNGLDLGEQFALDKDLIRIGAVAQDGGQKNDIVIRDVDHLISRFHCEIQKKDGLLYVTDLKSSNGSTLEGIPLTPGQPALLRKGARLVLANSAELRLGFGRRSKPRAA